ncbi:MAG: winged helix-turn-helix transcriptional regulator [Nitrososphaerota archaeon]|nr:winged helix-turn-helix transcriptional regulator [Nitrososphaerota archaeon]
MSESDLHGTTLRVYWFMLKSGHPLRLSDIQKNLRLSSPSLAQYHIKKLQEMGLVDEKQEGYYVEKVVVRSFFKVRSVILPFQAFFVAFFGLTFVALLVLLLRTRPDSFTSFEFVALMSNAVALLASVYGAMRSTRELP